MPNATEQTAQLLAKAAYDRLETLGKTAEDVQQLLVNAMYIVLTISEEDLSTLAQTGLHTSFKCPDVEGLVAPKRKRGRPKKMAS